MAEIRWTVLVYTSKEGVGMILDQRFDDCTTEKMLALAEQYGNDNIEMFLAKSVSP